MDASEYEAGVMEAQARLQYMEIMLESRLASEYRTRLETERVRDAQWRKTLAEENNRNMDIAQTIACAFKVQGLVQIISAALDDIEGANRLKRTANLAYERETEVSKQEAAEDSQANKEFRLLISTTENMNSSPHLLQPTAVTETDFSALGDLLDDIMKRYHCNDENMNRGDQMAILGQALPIVQQLLDQTPSLLSDPVFSGIQAFLPSIQRRFNELESESRHWNQTELQNTNPIEPRCSAGDWVRYFIESGCLIPETVLGLAKGLTRPVDVHDPSDWMSLFWEVSVSAQSSSIIQHDTSKGPEDLISVLDRASEIFALSYRHRVHGNELHGLRYRLQECCWAELRQVFEGAVEGRPHGRVVLWWDQVLGGTNKNGADEVPWATIGLLPYAVFRVVYNRPTRCEKHNPVYQGSNDFEAPADDQDIRRLWINLEHRLALRGRGLLTSRRAGAEGCVLWNLERAGPAWDGELIREIHGDDCVPMFGIRRIVSHLLRDKVGDRVTTFPEDVVQLQRWAATLAILHRKDWSSFLAGKIYGRQKLGVADVIRMVLQAGAPGTLDGGGLILPSAPTVECPRTSINRPWSGVCEWAPLLMDKPLDGWMQADVERESRQELEKFTVWVVFPIETDSQSSEAVAIGKLWTPVQAVSSYMLVWLELPTSFESWKAQGSSPDSFVTGSPVYAKSNVRMTQLVWPVRLNRFHETFCGVHWALRSLRTWSDQKLEYPMGLCSVLDTREPQANSALSSPRMHAGMLFSCMVEQWGQTMMENFAGKPIVQATSNQTGLEPAIGVPIGVMSGEEISWGR